ATSDPPPTDPPPASGVPPTNPPPPPPPPGGGNTDALLRAIIEAINAVNNKLTWVKNEIVNAISNVSNKIDLTNKKLDTTNTKLDTLNASVQDSTKAVNASADKVKAAVDANATTVKTAVDANTAATNNVKSAVDANTSSTANKLNDVVNAINNKPVGGGGTTDVKPVVAAIEKQTSDFKDMMKTDSSDFDTSQYEKIGDASDDPRSLNAQTDAANSLQSLSNKLTFSSSACVQDFTVSVPIFGTFTVPISRWCDLLALLKILLHLGTLMVAFKMLDSTVRAI
ncbi:TPA: methyl-accepting chemotaxis protein, partial [Acinetobacter nosocomialis]|nr:methyl-accepting chemotaxis protein [Acinetobacter nosocomialis]